MIRKILTSKRVWFGLIFLSLLLLASILYNPLLKEILPEQKKLLYTADKELLAAAPFSPIEMPPFGTDRFGIPLVNKIIEGAKYTIVFALLISFFRIFLGTIIGIFISMFTKRLKNFITGLSQAFNYVPTIFLAFILIQPLYISVSGEDTLISTQWGLTLYQIFVAIGIGAPTIAVFIANEIDEYRKSEHVLSSILMGATKIHLIRTHIWLYLKDKLLILFMQNIVHVLILFTHLGLLHLFIGGERIIPLDNGGAQSASLSNEWSGLLGASNYEMTLSPWIVISPLVAFTITIYIIKLMTEGVQDALNTRNVNSSIEKQEEDKQKLTIEKHLFTFAISRKNKGRANF
ncbi:ABC transporter permease subunit [Bacillus sp. 123MFChir2]|uniref:ABC transporter permease subunit n=1 Tax=Bacillus sp. 123MFChir2 TaxID=1169144 RepID=UPI000380CE5B|nr:ABC transporter permease subunit [Bacillus sp. 123MFChir2]